MVDNGPVDTRILYQPAGDSIDTTFHRRSLQIIDMKKSVCFGLVVIAASIVSVPGQTAAERAKAAADKVMVSPLPPAQPPIKTEPIRSDAIPPVAAVAASGQPIVAGLAPAGSQASNLTYKGLSFSQIKSRIAEAKRQMQTHTLTIASVEPSAMFTQVRIAYYDTSSHKVDYIVVTKDAFLTPNASTFAISTSGRPMTTRTIRANGVNTPVIVLDDKGQAQIPLLVQYPVEREGRYIETAYYMSTHPGLITPEVVSAGRFYVQNTIDIAREQLRTKGYLIQPKVADIAERLATVEHVDHMRFRTEFHPNIYNDIFTLYALNEGNTYRYSVSSAGAGGMVQMIPSTYRMVRARFPNALLMPDFVDGMRNHVNASQAMLLYMQMTWDDLVASPTVSTALQTGIATPEQLMAAGYNSNPARIAGYINRGGPGWTSLIPRETQIYLQIYSSLERAVVMDPRKL